jgi:alkylation response protein AidB-like acyl-CoA dehydrogenase
MTEPDAGSDLQGMRSTAVAKTPGGDLLLNGSKVRETIVASFV